MNLIVGKWEYIGVTRGRLVKALRGRKLAQALEKASTRMLAVKPHGTAALKGAK